MVQFIKKIIYLGIAFFICLFLLVKTSSFLVETRDFRNWNTESNLFFIKKDQHYDFLFLGISHARNFSRHHNHKRLEKSLNKSVINLGRGNALCGTGVLNEYVKYFYKRGNSADEIVYFVSSPVFYADFLDMSTATFEEEPFKVHFMIQYLQSDNVNKWQQMYYYLSSKLKPHWFNYMPKRDTINSRELDRVDMDIVKEGFKKAYLETLHEDIFKHNRDNINGLIDLAKEHHAQVTFIIPPALFGDWKGHDNVVEYLKELTNNADNIRYYDFAKAIDEPSYYYDHHHLNTKGIEIFIEQYLKRVI